MEMVESREKRQVEMEAVPMEVTALRFLPPGSLWELMC